MASSFERSLQLHLAVLPAMYSCVALQGPEALHAIVRAVQVISGPSAPSIGAPDNRRRRVSAELERGCCTSVAKSGAPVLNSGAGDPRRPRRRPPPPSPATPPALPAGAPAGDAAPAPRRRPAAPPAGDPRRPPSCYSDVNVRIRFGGSCRSPVKSRPPHRRPRRARLLQVVGAVVHQPGDAAGDDQLGHADHCAAGPRAELAHQPARARVGDPRVHDRLDRARAQRRQAV